MGLMVSEVYTALRAAGVPEKEAQGAAEALGKESAATKGDINDVKVDIQKVRGDLLLVKWMLGVVVAAEVLPLLKGLI